MEIIEMFIIFINKILDIKILDVSLITYLITFTMIIFVFKVIQILGNVQKNNRKEKSDKK